MTIYKSKGFHSAVNQPRNDNYSDDDDDDEGDDDVNNG